LLTLGLDYQEDRLETAIDYSEDSRDNLGVFGQYQGELGAASLHLSLRQDDNQQFGTNNTGNAALGWRFTDGVRGSISYGTAFKAPTFTDLYYPAPFGNPELEPEESESLELDLGGTIARNPWDARGGMSLFQTDIDQLIAYDPTTQTVENVAQAEIRGLELSGSARVMDWELSLSLTLQDPRNRSEGPNDGNLLARRPEQMGELNLDRRFERWSAGATLFVSGRRFDDPANTRTLPAYALVSLRADYAFTPALRIQGRVENLFDQEYETASYYNEPGTAVFVTLRYEP
jgi:vitamin B12 transporter